MGPRLVKRGKAQLISEGPTEMVLASMGPRLVRRGKTDTGQQLGNTM